MSRSDLRDKTFKYAWLMEIAGLTTRFFCGQRPPAKSIGWGGVNYTDLPVIQSLGSQTTRLNALGGVAEQGAMKVVLRAVQDAEPDEDPAVLLLRNGHREASRVVRLAATLPHDDADTDLILNRDVSGWPTIGGREVCHVGVETFVAQGGTDVSPPRFIVCDRAMLGTRVEAHVVDALQGWQPYVTSDVVTWTGRRVVIKRAAITGAPLVEADYEEVLRGFLDRPPQTLANRTVEVVCNPLTVITKLHVGGDAALTGFVRTHHLFTRGVRSVIAHTQIFKQGAMIKQLNPAPGDASLSGAIHVGSNRAMADNTDPTLPDGHPRRSAFHVSNALAPRMEASGVAPFAVATQIGVNVGTEPAGNTQGGGYVENVDLWDVHAVDLCGGADEALLRWPQDVIAAINAAWQPGTTTGADGAWCDVRLNISGDRPRVELLRNGQVIEGPLLVEFRSDWEEAGELSADYFAGQGYRRERRSVMTLGIDFADPAEEKWPDTADPQRWTRAIGVSRSRGNNQPSLQREIRGVAQAIYESGERHLLVKSDVLGHVAGSGAKWVQIVWTDPRGEQQKQVIPISAVAPELDGAGKLVGYRYTVGETYRRDGKARTCGEWVGGPLAEVRAAARWSRATGAQVLLEILLSGRGNGVNSGGYDVQPFGCNLSEDDLWLETFVNAPNIGPWSRPIVESVEVAEFIRPILQAMGCCLAMVLDEKTGRQRLALVPLGVEFAPDAAATIQKSHVAGGVGEPVEAPITVAYKLELGFDEATGEASVKPTYVDSDAKADAGGAGGTLQLKLDGLEVAGATDGAALGLRLISEMRARHGRPRRGYALTLYHGAAATAAIGRTVNLALEEFSGAARVTEITINHDQASAQLVLIKHGVNGAGWAPALKVTAVISARIVEVAANQYTLPQHPITGQDQTDLDYWITGDPCACVKRGQWAARISTTIDALDPVTRRVTLAADHLLSVGDTIRPQSYDASTAAQKKFLYVADANDKLGAANDRAKDWM